MLILCLEKWYNLIFHNLYYSLSIKTPTTRQYVVLAAKSVGKQTVNKYLFEKRNPTVTSVKAPHSAQ